MTKNVPISQRPLSEQRAALVRLVRQHPTPVNRIALRVFDELHQEVKQS